MALWDVPGLPEHLRLVYEKLSKARRLIMDGDARLSVYAGPVEKEDIPAIHELMSLGFVAKLKVGNRWVLCLGTWQVVEHRASLKGRISRFFTGEMEFLLKRYDQRQLVLIENAFKAFEAMRKRRKVSPKVLLRILQHWSGYPQEFVERGLILYLDGRKWAEGYGDRYATGCIRKVFRQWRTASAIKIPEGTQEREAREAHTEAEKKIEERTGREREQVLRLDAAVDELVKERYGENVKTADVPMSVLVKLRQEAAKRCT